MLRLMLAAIFGGVSAVAVQGSQTPSPQPVAFEVASVKRSPPDAEKNLNGLTSTISVATPGGRWRAQNVRLSLLIQLIYDILPEQLVGGPAWMNVDRFTIEAKAAGEPSRVCGPTVGSRVPSRRGSLNCGSADFLFRDSSLRRMRRLW